MDKLGLAKNKIAPFIGAISVFIGAIAFSGKAIMVKLVYQHEVDYITLLALRMGFSLPFFLIIAFFSKPVIAGSEFRPKDFFGLFFLGLIGYYLSSIFDFAGLQYVTASLERLILFIYPTLVVIMSAIFLKKKITPIIYLALALTYVGIFIVFYPELQLMPSNLLSGSILIFLAAFTYALYLMGSGSLIPKFGVILYTCYVMSIASIAVLIHFLISTDLHSLHLDNDVYFYGAAMAIFCTVLPSFLISYGIKLIGAGKAAIIGSVGPVSTLIMAYVFLGERITFVQLMGTTFVLAGVIIVGSLGKK